MARLIVFDCDGTLVDSQHLIVAAASQAFVAHGLAPPPAPAVHAVIGLSLDMAFAMLHPDSGLEERALLVEGYRSAWRSLREDGMREPLYPGALATIEELGRRGHTLAIATGKSRPGLLSVLDHHGLTPLFASLQTADRHPSKPDPSMLEQAMHETGSAPGATLMVGDTTFDMAMAAAAGVGAVGVGWGYHPVDALAQAGATTVLERFEDLLGLVPERAG
ncbi:MAG TPA: HAD-IA family hydrolase [Geminicoccaceae bacterium]|nr:HAD-IA family hydrolase [Geminicoccaceae bacterium]